MKYPNYKYRNKNLIASLCMFLMLNTKSERRRISPRPLHNKSTIEMIYMGYTLTD